MLKAEEKKLSECLTRQKWLRNHQDEACDDSLSVFNGLINTHSFKKNTANAQLTNGINDLWICKAPKDSNGLPISLAEYTSSTDLTNLFLNLAAEPSGVIIPTVPPGCTGDILTKANELMNLSVMIGGVKAMSKKINEEVETCLQQVDDEFTTLFNDESSRFDAADTAVNDEIDKLFPILGFATESKEAFRERMNMIFKGTLANIPDDYIELLPNDPLLNIPGLPHNASPANIFHRKKVVDATELLRENNTFLAWLMMELTN